MLKEIQQKKTSLNCRGRLIDFKIPKIMGILNITPDSFYDGGKYHSLDQIRLQIQQMIEQGADIIDIGACSTRPGAMAVNEKEELARLKPVLELIIKHFPGIIVSVDTYRAEIADTVVTNYPVSIINDISAGNLDEKMYETIAKLQVPYIMMHMQGTPENMQITPVYANVTEEIISFFSAKLALLRDLGVHDIIVDPGFGFGKTLVHNYELLQNLEHFQIFGLPLLVGLSRKSMIYRFLDIKPEEALNGTTVVNTMALIKGADIIRVHDVAEARQTLEIYRKWVDPSWQRN